MNEKEIIQIYDGGEDNNKDDINNNITTTTTTTTATTTNKEIIELPSIKPTTTTTTTNVAATTAPTTTTTNEKVEEEIIEHVRLFGLLNDITKFNEQKRPQIKQEAIITIEKIVQSFLKTILSKSMTTNNNRLQLAEIYKVLLDYDLEFLTPSNGIALRNTDEPVHKYFENDNNNNGDVSRSTNLNDNINMEINNADDNKNKNGSVIDD